MDLNRVVLVGCGKSKLAHPAKARDLYTSTLFKLSLRYAETLATPAHIFVLSAMHGVIALDTEVEPYERKLSDLGGKREREAWGDRAISHLASMKAVPRRADRGELVVLAGEAYVLAIGLSARDMGWQLVEPMSGLQQGERLRWLNGQLARAGAS